MFKTIHGARLALDGIGLFTLVVAGLALGIAYVEQAAQAEYARRMASYDSQRQFASRTYGSM